MNSFLHFPFFILVFTSVFLSKSNALEIEEHLQKIHDLSTNSELLTCQHQKYTIVPISLDTEEYRAWEQKAQLAATLIEETQSIGHQKLIESTLRHLLSQNTIIQEVFYNTTTTLKHSKIY